MKRDGVEMISLPTGEGKGIRKETCLGPIMGSFYTFGRWRDQEDAGQWGIALTLSCPLLPVTPPVE